MALANTRRGLLRSGISYVLCRRGRPRSGRVLVRVDLGGVAGGRDLDSGGSCCGVWQQGNQFGVENEAWGEFHGNRYEKRGYVVVVGGGGEDVEGSGMQHTRVVGGPRI